MATNETSRDGVTDETAHLEVKDVSKWFGNLTAVDGASFTVEKGSITGLIGPNGAGKSTLFNCITGVQEIDAGEIWLNGDEIQNLSPYEIARAGLGRTFQTPQVFRGMTVRANLAFAAMNHPGERILPTLFRPGTVRESEDSLQDEIEEILEFLSLEDHADTFANGLSGGQRKLLELGRVLMMEPEIILLDEPTAGVNPSLTDELLNHLHELNDQGRTILLVEHDMDVVMNHCDRVVVLHNGQVISVGTPTQVQEDEQVVDAYLGGVD